MRRLITLSAVATGREYRRQYCAGMSALLVREPKPDSLLSALFRSFIQSAANDRLPPEQDIGCRATN